MEDTSINKNLVEQSICYHGLPLVKAWREEVGPNSLINLGIQANSIDTSIYHERQKNLHYTDQTKRMRLHQFMCNKSNELFRNFKIDPIEKTIEKLMADGGDDLMPPMEYFSNLNHDERISKFFTSIKAGDIIYGTIMHVTNIGLMVKILCSIGGTTCLVSDLSIKGFVPSESAIPALDSKRNSEQFIANDYVCCEVLEISDRFPQIILGMQAVHQRFDKGPALGLIKSSDMPKFYKLAVDPQNQQKSFNQLLRESDSFRNPGAIENLYLTLSLTPKSYCSIMSKNKFAQDEYAKDLRQAHAGRLAFRSVAEGICHFKEGRHEEAYQCLNKALTIDPRNVEGLVARGALNANNSCFQKAIIDFEAALKINPNHNNAKKYLGETLLALGRSLEEENKLEDAQKAYIECLNINPHHQEALASLNYIKTKLNSRKIVEPAELELPPLSIGSISSKDSKMKDESRGKKSKKDKKKKGKKRHSSSSESSSDSSDSSESSSESSENSSSSSGSESRSKKKSKKRKSPSPVSKRLDLSEPSKFHQYAQSNSFDPLDDHEIKVKKFLEMSRDEDDYEEKVGQLIAEASKYQKTKQAEEAKSAKKKKKMEKKMKKEKRKKKKEDKKKSKETEMDKIREALKVFESLPEKVKKLYQEKIKEEDAKQKENATGSDEGKWKMKFKTESEAKAKKASNFSLYDSDDEDQIRNLQSHAPSQSTTNTYTGNLMMASSSGSGIKVETETAPTPVPPVVNPGPIVLDKFGNFRRVEPQPAAPVVQSPNEGRRSRSKGRRSSRSRSNSRSPRRRRSRSRRRFSRSPRSRSYSRSPSRGGRGFRRGGSSMARGGFRQRGRWNDYRNDSWDYRRERFDRDRRGGGRGGGRFGKYGRSTSRSPDRSPHRRERERDDDMERRSREGSKKDDVKW